MTELHKCNNVFSNKMKPLHVSANDGHQRKVTNTSKEMLHMLSCMGYTSSLKHIAQNTTKNVINFNKSMLTILSPSVTHT
jgi:hypothetical protein